MVIKDACLDVIATRRSQYPEDGKAEFLLVGRSNVGKSSFINAILGRKNLAHTSATPGKTQTLNFYKVNDQFYLIDVPGYGYASVDRKTQAKFGMMIEEYLEKRIQLRRVFLLIDFRHKPSEDDIMMYNFLKYYNLPVTVIATKSDKVSGGAKQRSLRQVLDTLDLVVGDDLVVFSSVSKIGVNEVLDKIESLLVDEII